MKTQKIWNWVDVLNDHSEWKSADDVERWLGSAINKKNPNLNRDVAKKFFETLSRMRECIYEAHLGTNADYSWLNDQVKDLKLTFDFSQDQLHLPALRGAVATKKDDDLLEAIRGAILIQFANHLSMSLAAGTEICARCEGLYRDSNAVRLSMVPEVDENAEMLWRNEIDLLIEQSLQREKEIQRCADLFPAGSRSKYCSDKCRFNTFQIAKQFKDPNYLAEKQRRYRAKKNEAN